jgi:bacteriocin biosynthesis cyclodehydratase domain-containing protein
MFKPKIKDCYDVVPETPNRYQVRSSEMVSVMKGATVEMVFDKLLPLMDGQNTIEDIIERLGPSISPDLIGAVVAKLSESGIVENAEVEVDQGFATEELERYHSQMTFFQVTGETTEPLQSQKNIKASRVAIIGCGQLASGIASQVAHIGVGRIFGANLDEHHQVSQIDPAVSFAAAGIALDDFNHLETSIEDERPSLLILSLDRPEPLLLNYVNDLSQKRGLSLLLCQINGTEGIVGPFVVPGLTACLICHHLRVTRNLDYYQEYQAWEKWVTSDNKRQRAHPGSIYPFTEMIASIATIEILKHVSEFYEPETYSKFITVNALRLEVITHPVLKLPRCPGCGKAQIKGAFSPYQEKR